MSMKLMQLVASQEDASRKYKRKATKRINTRAVILADEAMDKAVAAFEEVQVLVGAAGEARAAINQLHSLIKGDATVLANPKSASSSVVHYSNEAFAIICDRLGGVGSTVKLSAEEVNKSPVTALRMSMEEKQSFLKEMIDKLKILFKKIKEAIKRYGAAAIVAMAGISKKAASLKEGINAIPADAKAGELSAEEIKSLSGKLPALTYKGAVPSQVVSNAKAILDDASSLGKIKALGEFFNSIEKAIYNFGAELAKSPNTAAKTLNSAVAAAGKKLEGNSFKDDIIDKAVKEAVDGIPANQKFAFVYKYAGSELTALVVTTPAIDTGKDLTANDAVAFARGIGFTKVTIPFSKIGEKELKAGDVYSKGQLLALADLLVGAGKDIKGYHNNVSAMVKDIDTTMNTLEKSDLIDVAKPAVIAIIKAGREIVSSVAPNLLWNYLTTTKALMALTAGMAGKYKVKASSEDEGGETVTMVAGDAVTEDEEKETEELQEAVIEVELDADGEGEGASSEEGDGETPPAGDGEGEGASSEEGDGETPPADGGEGGAKTGGEGASSEEGDGDAEPKGDGETPPAGGEDGEGASSEEGDGEKKDEEGDEVTPVTDETVPMYVEG